MRRIVGVDDDVFGPVVHVGVGAIDPGRPAVAAHEHARRIRERGGAPPRIGGHQRTVLEHHDVVGMALGARWVREFAPGRRCSLVELAGVKNASLRAVDHAGVHALAVAGIDGQKDHRVSKTMHRRPVGAAVCRLHDGPTAAVQSRVGKPIAHVHVMHRRCGRVHHSRGGMQHRLVSGVQGKTIVGLAHPMHACIFGAHALDVGQ